MSEPDSMDFFYLLQNVVNFCESIWIAYVVECMFGTF